MVPSLFALLVAQQKHAAAMHRVAAILMCSAPIRWIGRGIRASPPGSLRKTRLSGTLFWRHVPGNRKTARAAAPGAFCTRQSRNLSASVDATQTFARSRTLDDFVASYN